MFEYDSTVSPLNLLFYLNLRKHGRLIGNPSNLAAFVLQKSSESTTATMLLLVADFMNDIPPIQEVYIYEQ